LALVVQQLAAQMQEEITVQIQYLTQPHQPAAVVVVLHLSPLHLAKMAARAAGVRNQRQAAQEFRDKVLQVVQA
jgi:hypothetical protein